MWKVDWLGRSPAVRSTDTYPEADEALRNIRLVLEEDDGDESVDFVGAILGYDPLAELLAMKAVASAEIDTGSGTLTVTRLPAGNAAN